MSHVIEIDDALFDRLAKLARPFVDTHPADVIQRLAAEQGAADMNGEALEPTQLMRMGRPRPLETRSPRERGVRVDVNGQTITADSVRDLFEQVLHLVAKNGVLEKVKALAPYKTSRKRYLIAERPVHPSGSPFVVPVEYRGLYMETHKSYRTAVTQLAQFLSKLGITLRYIG